MTPPSSRAPETPSGRLSWLPAPARRHAPWLAWLSFVFLAIGASPAHFWLDSGEIAAAGAELGVMHPTGVPGYVPLLHLATALPLGSLGFRMALCSSACAAGAIGLLLAMLERRRVHWGLSWIIGLWLPLGLTLARNGRVVEVYGFAALLAMATLWGFDPAVERAQQLSRRCVGVLAAVVAAWGFGDLRLALAPAVVLAWALALRRREPWARWAPLCVVLASLVVLTLPLASARGPMADWGNPETASAVWAHVQATAIRDSFAGKLTGMGARAWSLHARLTLDRLLEDLGPFGVLLGIAALGFGLSRPLSRQARARQGSGTRRPLADFVDDDHRLLRWLAWVALVEVIYAVAINPMGGRDRQTGLVLGLLVALCVGLGVHRWLAGGDDDRGGEAPSRKRLLVLPILVLPLLACALWIPAGYESLPDLRATRSWAPHDWTREALARTPTDALVLSQSDDLTAGLAAARMLEGARPDVIAIPAQHLYREPSEWQLAEPRRAAVWQAAAAAPAEEGDRGRILAVLGRWRGPVMLESPATAVLAGVALPGEGEPPLWSSVLPVPRDALPINARIPGDTRDPLADAIARWRGRLDAPVDRERLADAMALWIHGRFALAPDSPVRWLEAERGYRLILDEVDPDHARSLVDLAAARDRFGATDEAIALSRRALEIDPERATALANLALYLSRDLAALDEARELAELAVELAADKPSHWSRLALVCRQQRDEACVARAEQALARP